MKSFFFVGLLVFLDCFGMKAIPPLGEVLSNRIFTYKHTHSSPFLEKLESDGGV